MKHASSTSSSSCSSSACSSGEEYLSYDDQADVTAILANLGSAQAGDADAAAGLLDQLCAIFLEQQHQGGGAAGSKSGVAAEAAVAAMQGGDIDT